MANIIDKIRAKGEQLSAIRSKINDLEEAMSKALSTLKEERDGLNIELLELLTANELTSIKTSSGESFIRAKRKGYQFDEFRMLPWATERGLVKIDSLRLKQAFAQSKPDELPEGVTMVENEYISVRKPKAETETKGEASGE